MIYADHFILPGLTAEQALEQLQSVLATMAENPKRVFGITHRIESTLVPKITRHSIIIEWLEEVQNASHD